MGGTGLVCLYQKEQVQDDMQTTRATLIEQMLESSDHLIERHRADRVPFDRIHETPHLPEGCVLYSAQCAFGDIGKRWSVELMDTTRPYQDDSIFAAQNGESLDAALEEAGWKVLASRSTGRR
jgi:hypothetical protein